MTTNKIENAKTLLFTDKEQYLRFKKLWAHATKTEYLTAKHHMLYNIVRGHDTSRGFTFVTKPSKLANGFRINGSEYFAWLEISRMQYGTSSLEFGVRALMNDEFDLKWWNETFKKIHAEGKIKVDSLESNFAKGRKIAQEIIKRNAKPITYQDLWDLYEEAA